MSLGPEAELLPPAPDNPEGFWENRRFLAVNEIILAKLGGSWARPPHFPPGWDATAPFAPVLAYTRALAASFATEGVWGWKDPVNSLTLPLWRQAIPDLAVVVCVRHPRDVAASLSARHGCSEEAGLDLWLRYTKRLLGERGTEPHVVTHYDAYFDDGPRELRRVLSALGLPADEPTIAGALASLQPRLRHHRVSRTRATLPAEVAIPYTVLCNEAGRHAEVDVRRSQPPAPNTDPPACVGPQAR
jgi:hypothetical protein